MRKYASVLISGVIFGLGLTISQMTDPAKVIGFLDVAGNWDPTLAFVMLGALCVAIPAFRFILRRNGPLFGGGFSLPTKKDLDARLICGAALFGVGWGLGGFCPGPALTALSTGLVQVFIFVGAMFFGALIYKLVLEKVS